MPFFMKLFLSKEQSFMTKINNLFSEFCYKNTFCKKLKIKFREVMYCFTRITLKLIAQNLYE